MQGSDGKIYRGSPQRGSPNVTSEKKIEKIDDEEKQVKSKRLLAMKWDHIGLQ